MLFVLISFDGSMNFEFREMNTVTFLQKTSCLGMSNLQTGKSKSLLENLRCDTLDLINQKHEYHALCMWLTFTI